MGYAMQVMPPRKESARYYKQTSAPRYDPFLRDYVTQGGKTVDEHPVDQRVCLLIGTLYGKIAGDSTSGLLPPDRSSRQDSEKRWRRAVLACLDPVISAGDIEILDISLEYPKRGEVALGVSYKNLRLRQETATQTKRFLFGGSS